MSLTRSDLWGCCRTGSGLLLLHPGTTVFPLVVRYRTLTLTLAHRSGTFLAPGMVKVVLYLGPVLYYTSSVVQCHNQGGELDQEMIEGLGDNAFLNRGLYSTRTKGFVRCPLYTKSGHLHHSLPLHNVYDNQRKFHLALSNL